MNRTSAGALPRGTKPEERFHQYAREPHARGVYTGAIGYFGFNGLSHFNIAIRTAVYQNGRLTFHAGGGIVADSEPEAEYAETFAKAEGIIRGPDQLRLR